MYCRIVGHFFHHVPSDAGLAHIVREVSSTAGDKQKLLDLGQLYYDHALLFFRCAKGQTPDQSDNPSRPSFGNVADLIKANLEEAPQSHQTAQKRALVRDGFKCLITGAYDVKSIKQSAQLRQEAKARGKFAVTVCAHIFSESTDVDVSEGSSKADDAASAWAVLSRFGGCQNLFNELNGAQVHRLENIMTLDPSVGSFFDDFDLWLEPEKPEGPTGAEDKSKSRYYVKASIPDLLQMYPTVVEFSTIDPINLPLPSRDYLALHAACAKVAHLSGAAEYMDSVFSDMEEEELVLKYDDV